MQDTIISPPAVVLSEQQLAIVRHVESGRGNLLVIARAGTGKTFLIRQCLPVMRGKIAIAAYNNKIAAELSEKVREDGNRADVATFHSFGYRAIRRALPKAKIEGDGARNAGFKKFDRIADELEIAPYLRGFVRTAMSLAMQGGFGVLVPLNDPSEWLAMVAHHDIDRELADDNVGLKLHGREKLIKVGCQLAAKAIKLGIQIAHEVVSFDDMLYLPLVLDMQMEQYQWVAVDESQDSNRLRREMARRMASDRMLWVGDDRQSIYGFTGADNDALDQIAEQFNCRRFPMTETRRCSQAVVARARELVPDYTAHPSNPPGLVRTITPAQFEKEKLVPGDDVIICRFTAPLVKSAHDLIRRGVGAHVAGRDIGANLIALVNRWPSIKSVTTFKERLLEYCQKEVGILLAAKKDAKAAALEDRVASILAIMETLPANATLATLKNDIADLFREPAPGSAEAASMVTLMTAHRSKGLEFKRVFGWMEFSIPPFARQEWQRRQEENLEYVRITRAIIEYVEVTA